MEYGLGTGTAPTDRLTEDACLVHYDFLEGGDVAELERATPDVKRRISGAVRRLKRLVKDGASAITATRPEPAQLVGE